MSRAQCRMQQPWHGRDVAAFAFELINTINSVCVQTMVRGIIRASFTPSLKAMAMGMGSGTHAVTIERYLRHSSVDAHIHTNYMGSR